MARKPRTPQELLHSYDEKILDSQKRWNYLKKNGGSSPFYADGCDLNLVRNHIIYLHLCGFGMLDTGILRNGKQNLPYQLEILFLMPRPVPI